MTARGTGPEIRSHHGYLDGVGGLRVFERGWQVEHPRGTVLVVHGLGEHSGRYEDLARSLCAKGFGVHALDVRGHGRSEGSRGHVRRFEQLIQDLDRLRRVVRGRGRTPRPLFLVGHSLGGLLVLRYAQEMRVPELEGIVAVAPFLGTTLTVPAWKRRLAAVADRVAPCLTLGSQLDPERLFEGEEARERYRMDPLVHGRISARLWHEMLREAERTWRAVAAFPVPVLFQVAGAESVVDAAAIRRFAERLPPARSELLEYPGALHGLYHGAQRARAISDAASWISDRVRQAEVCHPGAN